MVNAKVYTLLFFTFLSILSYSKPIEHRLFFYACKSNKLVVHEGFAAGTLVKTRDGYQPIEFMRPGCMVMAYDFKNERQVLQRVLCVQKVWIQDCCHVTFNNQTIITGADQRFYDFEQSTWVGARSLGIQGKNHHKISTYFYQLCVEGDHNFYITESDLLVHNVIPMVVIGPAFGASSVLTTISAMAASCAVAIAPVAAVGVPVVVSGVVVWKIGAYLMTKNNGNNSGSNHVPKKKRDDGPDDPDRPQKSKKKNKKDDEERKEYLKREKKKKRDEARANYKPLTNKEARDVAGKLGYTETKSHPCEDAQERAVFINNNAPNDLRYISPDKTGHSGAAWKAFDSNGNIRYSMDIGLVEVIKIY